MDKEHKNIAIACTGAKNMQLEEFKALQGNLKTISPENLDILKQRIIKYGFDAPIFVWGKYILDGHQRLIAITSLLEEGYAVPDDALPVCEIKAKNKADAKKRLLGYISQYGHITAEGLEEFVSDLDLAEISKEIDLPGFTLEGLEDVNYGEVNDAEAQIDQADELQQKWLVNPGDVWMCGQHRIMCGDSLNESDLRKLLGDSTADILITDPPYNVGYVGKTKDKLTIDNDIQGDAEFYKFLLNAFTNICQVIKAGGSFYVFHADVEVVNFRTALTEAGFLVKQGLVWNKNTMVLGRSDYQWKHEPILYGWKDGAGHYWNADRKQTTVWEFNKPSSSTLHPTMKPVELLIYAIKNSSKKDQIVLDAFIGSGSTLVACENSDRICYGMEIAPKYVAVTLQRYFDLTGNEPRRLNES